MTTQEQIAVMQAYAEGACIQYKRKDSDIWVYTANPIWDWNTFKYRVKPEPTLPKTWEEFCETDKAQVIVKEWDCKYFRAFDALCKLIQLRDCYNDGWQPDWSAEGYKYPIYFYDNKCVYSLYFSHDSHVLSFKTDKLRNVFYENFKDLIEIAKPLI